MERIVMHIDVNSAFLSWSAVDLLKKGSALDIRTLPSIIGYKNSKRHGIVLAVSMPAKKLGIKTAEPIYMAMRKCKDLMIVEPDYKLYNEMSDKFHNLVNSYTPDFEKYSIDECFIEYGPVRNLYGDPIKFAEKLKNEIYEKYGFTVNVGIGSNKLLAKMASDFEKPNKVHTLFTNEIETKMFPLPIKDLFGCGKKTCEVLESMNIKTIGELARYDKEILIRRFKKQGLYLWETANGIDNTPVGEYKAIDASISKEVTLPFDTVDKDELYNILGKLTSDVSFTLRKQGKYCSVVSVYIKYHDFSVKRKQKKYNKQFNNEDEIFKCVSGIFNILWNGSPIRLIGVKLSGFSENIESQLSLFDTLSDTNKSLQTVLDNINTKYGKNMIHKVRLKKK
jgi:DNA polymerase-4